jgi:hypothetical protein
MDIRTALPAEVLAALAPAAELVAQEAREGTMIVETNRALRTGKVFVRANGNEFRRGTDQILTSVYPGVTVDSPERDVYVEPPEPSDDDDEDDEEDAPECEEACATCGCCGECDNGRHGDSDPDSRYLYTNRLGATYCSDCEHECD